MFVRCCLLSLISLSIVSSAFALPPTTAEQNKFVSANLKGFVIQDGQDVTVTSFPQSIGPSNHYRFNTSGKVKGTGLLASSVPSGTDIVEGLGKLQTGLGNVLRGYVFESVFGDTYPIFNRTFSQNLGLAAVSGRLESGVADGIASFSIFDFSFTNVLTGHDPSTTIVFEDVLLVGESEDIMKSDINFDANADLILLKGSQVQAGYLNSTAFLGGKSSKAIVNMPGVKLTKGFNIVGVHDFDQDGNVDLLISKGSQTKAILLNLEKLKGANLNASLLTGPTLASGHKVGGVGDFNLDGNWDIISFNPKSGVSQIILLAKGMGVLSVVDGPAIPKGFEIVSVSDFNDDSTSDLLLYNPTNRKSSVATLVGAAQTSTINGPTLPKDWTMLGSSGFDNNRSIDLAIYNSKLNQVKFYTNKGATFATISKSPGKALTLPAGVKAVGPR